MEAVAKVFMHGGSQAVRLPKKFRFDADAVRLYRDAASGHLVMQPMLRETALQQYLTKLNASPPLDDDWVPQRIADTRPDPFADWEEPV